MKQNFKLNINNPCSQRFENFEATQNGGFCTSCQKEVIDFTKMSEEEIKNYFKNASERTCGRFHNFQLKTYSGDKKKSKSKLGLGVLGMSVLSLFTISTGQAQNSQQMASVQVSKEQTREHQNEAQAENQTVSGIVFDEHGEPLPGVNVYIKHNLTTGTRTDVEGKFKLKIPKSDMKDTLVFSFIGYDTQEFILPKNPEKIPDIKLRMSYCDIMGEISVNQIYQSKPSLWQRIKNTFRKKHE